MSLKFNPLTNKFTVQASPITDQPMEAPIELQKFILQAPDGSRWELTISPEGVLTTSRI